MATKLVAEFDRPAEDDPRLGDREAEILRLVAEGCANREIAERLVLSPHTVERYIANILKALPAQPLGGGKDGVAAQSL